MSTRAIVHFINGRWGDEPIARVYNHGDGYPEGVGADLFRFFEDVKDQCEGTVYGTRFDDPSYLAAKYVVWCAERNAGYLPNNEGKPLSFGSLGIMESDPGDIEYRYVVNCTHPASRSPATAVTWLRASGPTPFPDDDRLPEVTCYATSYSNGPGELVEDFAEQVAVALASKV